MTDYKRKTKGRRDEDMEHSYSKSTVSYLKVAGLILSILSVIGGVNTMYMSSISSDLKEISKSITLDRIKVNLIKGQTELALSMASENKDELKKVTEELNEHILNDARRRGK